MVSGLIIKDIPKDLGPTLNRIQMPCPTAPRPKPKPPFPFHSHMYMNQLKFASISGTFFPYLIMKISSTKSRQNSIMKPYVPIIQIQQLPTFFLLLFPPYFKIIMHF